MHAATRAVAVQPYPIRQRGEITRNAHLRAGIEVNHLVPLRLFVLPAHTKVAAFGQHTVRVLLECSGAHARHQRFVEGVVEEGDHLVRASLLLLLQHELADAMAREVQSGALEVERNIRELQ